MKDEKIVILAGSKSTTNIIYHSLEKDFSIEKVIIEEPVSKILLLKKRVRKLGLLKVLGQILFQLIIVPYLRLASKRRILELQDRFGFDQSPIDKAKVVNVKSVNSGETIRSLQVIQPDVVLVTGTRIIAKEVINCTPARFINIHVGITPLYRGVHGAYWALTEKNKQACGVTVHLVDTGVDTGGILEQELIYPISQDNFSTYPLLQLATGITLLKKAIRNVLGQNIQTKQPPQGQSKLWSHPTLWEYIWFRFRMGVK